MSKVYISETKNTGKGLFAKKDIQKDEVVFIVKGSIMKDGYDTSYQIGPNWFGIGKNVWLATFEHNPCRYLNHSCNPNVGRKGKVTVVAMRNIKKDEQITMDYSITEDDPHWKMPCNCGQKNCRKMITSIRFLPLKLYRKYEKYIPKYLKEEYKLANNIPE